MCHRHPYDAGAGSRTPRAASRSRSTRAARSGEMACYCIRSDGSSRNNNNDSSEGTWHVLDAGCETDAVRDDD